MGGLTLNLYLNVYRLQPSYIVSKINENFSRFDALFSEDMGEIHILSDELTQVLSNSLMSEYVKLSSRRLDTSRTSLELDRGAKNRANALKIFSILIAANITFTISSDLGASTPVKLIMSILAIYIAWRVTNWYIRIRSSYVRMIIPVNTNVPARSLDKLTKSRELKDFQMSGTRMTCGWSQNFVVYPEKVSRISRVFRRYPLVVSFDLTIDYEARGYLYSIALSTEHNNLRFNVRELIIQTLDLLYHYGCMEKIEKTDTSLLAKVLQHVDIPLEDDMIGLNSLMSYSVKEIEDEIRDYQDPGEDITPGYDKEYIKDLLDQAPLYRDYLSDVRRGKSRDGNKIDGALLLRLLGKKNVDEKINVISKYC